MRRFTYNPSKGLLTCKKTSKEISSVKSLDEDLLAKVGKRKYTISNLIYLYMVGDFPTEQIRHLDNDYHNNKWVNLVLASEAKYNLFFREAKNSTGFSGVTKTLKGFKAQFRLGKQTVNLGVHPTAKTASDAYMVYVNKTFMYSTHKETDLPSIKVTPGREWRRPIPLSWLLSTTKRLKNS